MVRPQALAYLTAALTFPSVTVIAARARSSERVTRQPGSEPGSPPVAVTQEPLPISLDAARIASARDWLQRIGRGSIDRTQIEPTLNTMLTDDVIRGGVRLMTGFGSPTTMFPFETRTTADGTAAYYRVKYPADTLTWILSVAQDGRINGFTLRRRPRDVIYSVMVRNVESW